MSRTAFAALSLLLCATPVTAQVEGQTPAELERKARICLTSGAPGAPRESLLAAVVALRTLCAPQITRLRKARLDAVDAAYPPDERITPRQREAREDARDDAKRRLNGEIAYAVSNFTGLNS
ncbi:hypothetical protein [Tsuneonella sp. HG222]